MQVSQAVKKRVLDELDRLVAIAEAHYGRTFKLPTIDFNMIGSAGGQYVPAHRRKPECLRFNSVLLMENTEKFMVSTVPHELAHFLDHCNHPENFERRPGRKRDVHGATWRRTMNVLGVSKANRCHDYDVTNSRKGAGKPRVRYDYRCSCGEVLQLGPGRHRNMQKGNRIYTHTKCFNSKLTFIGQHRAEAPAAAPTPKTGDTKMSKQSQANAIFQRLPSTSRQGVISAIVAELGVSEGYAGTLYAKAKKTKGAPAPAATVPSPTGPIPTYQKITKFDGKNLDEVRAALEPALAEVLARFGLSADCGNIRYGDDNFRMQLKVAVGTKDDAAKREWELYAIRFGLKESDFGRTFTNGGKQWTVVGIAPRSSKAPVLAANANGTIYKFPSKVLGGKGIPGSDVQFNFD